MTPTNHPACGGGDFDPTTILWLPGIDYVRGWREATDAAAELLTALVRRHRHDHHHGPS